MKRYLLIPVLTWFITFSHAAVGEDKHIACFEPNSKISDLFAPAIQYISAIFFADSSNSAMDDYRLDFHNWLENKRHNPSFAGSFCIAWNSKRAAESGVEDHISNFETANALEDNSDVVHTNWAPDPFSNQPLHDFNIQIASDERTVEVCVRDHECEDGDEVRVSVNSGQVFQGEIDNDWACEEVTVHEGKNQINLFAVNGTGHKGSCSHANVNTGEIRVQGENTESQSWRHRGGAGSDANIIVEVR